MILISNSHINHSNSFIVKPFKQFQIDEKLWMSLRASQPIFAKSLNTMPQSKHQTDLKNKVLSIFTSYLELKQLRRTPERFAILDEIYSIKGHFDVEQLFEKMKDRKYTVSRATVYNTLDLLLECNLVIKHQFGATQAVFEKGFGFRQHDHLICNKCNKILEFCDPRIQQIQNMMGELLEFNISNHSLYLYGEPQTNADGGCKTCGKNVNEFIKEN